MPKRNLTRGQSTSEYGIIAALVAIIALGSLSLLGQNISQGFQAILPKYSGKVAISAISQNGEKGQNTPSTGQNQALAALSQGSFSGLSSQQGTTIQVSGSNGTSNKINANMQQMTQLAQQYKDSNPEVYNAIIKLGEKGKELAQAIQSCEQGCSSETIDDLRYQFEGIWNQEVYGSGIYKQLNTEDQNTVLSLTNNSGQLAADASNQVTVKTAEAGGGVKATSQSSCTNTQGPCTAKGSSTATMSVSGQAQVNTTSSSSNGFSYNSSQSSGNSYSYNQASGQVSSNSQQTITCGKQGNCTQRTP